MVAGFHLIWTAYGWWLPNDPRGSSSHEIRVERIAQLGELHYGRKFVQPSGRTIKDFYGLARRALKHPLMTLDEADIEIVAAAFARVIAERHYTCYACAIMPDHVHVLIRKHRDRCEAMIDSLREASREWLIETGRRDSSHPVWGDGPGWKVFLNTREDFVRVVEYVRENPIKARRPPQQWKFVEEYDGWMPGQYRS
jgi:REP element-mobilizing transposase RayT